MNNFESEPVCKPKDLHSNGTLDSQTQKWINTHFFESANNYPNMHFGGVLGRQAISDCIKKNTIVIEPFDKKNLQTSSYDVTLGENFFREKIWNEPFNGIANVHGKSEMWNEKPSTAKPFSEIAESVKNEGGQAMICINELDFNISDKFIFLAPGENILAHTNEFIGTRSGSNLTTSCHTKSTLGRTNILTCKCAGWGDIGYYNRWTLEITNNSKSNIIVKVGTPLAQIVFWTVIGSEEDANYVKEGSYQTETSIEKLMAEWNPQMMLPKKGSL